MGWVKSNPTALQGGGAILFSELLHMRGEFNSPSEKYWLRRILVSRFPTDVSTHYYWV